MIEYYIDMKHKKQHILAILTISIFLFPYLSSFTNCLSDDSPCWLETENGSYCMKDKKRTFHNNGNKDIVSSQSSDKYTHHSSDINISLIKTKFLLKKIIKVNNKHVKAVNVKIYELKNYEDFIIEVTLKPPIKIHLT